MSAYLLIPKTATPDNPAPAIVTSHGYLNTKEMADANYVELARRGFVVLSIDQPDHGDSEVTPDFFILAPDGVYQGVLALSRMPFVDSSRIGVTGHSMGSWSVNAAVQADNLNETPLIASVLIHCNDPLYQDDYGGYANPYGSRDVAVISAVYDEFFGTSVDADGETLYSPYFMQSATAQAFLNFGRDPAQSELRREFTEYREDVDGKETLRIIYRPPIIQYVTYFNAKHMMWSQPTMADPNYPMFVLWLFPVILILFGSTLISRAVYKSTKNPYIAGIINAVIVGLMTITNTCTTFM